MLISIHLLAIRIIPPPPGTEYVADIPPDILISAGMNEGCFGIELLDDNIYEPQEQFIINARLQEGSTTPDATTTVLIDDNEGELRVVTD